MSLFERKRKATLLRYCVDLEKVALCLPFFQSTFFTPALIGQKLALYQLVCSSVDQSIGPARCSRRFDSPVRQGIFLPESTFSAVSLTVSVTPPCAIACIYICAHVKDPVVHVRVRWIMEILKTSSMHRRLGSATLSQLASPGEGKPNFP